jgi:hypothetical protein
VHVGHERALQVTQQLLSGHSKLHNVADATKREAFEEGQPSLNDGLRAGVAATWQLHLLACQALQVRGKAVPQAWSVHVVVAVHVDEVGRTIGQQHGPVTTLLRMHAEQSLISKSEAGRVNLRDAKGRLIHTSTDSLRHAFPQNSTEGFELVGVETLNESQDLRWLKALPVLSDRCQT